MKDALRRWFLRGIKEVGDGLLSIKTILGSYTKRNLSIILIMLAVAVPSYSKPLSLGAMPPNLAKYELAQCKADDPRPAKIVKFLSRYSDSPLPAYAPFIVSVADKFGLDYRLYVAIAGCESTFGRQYIRANHNLTGIGSGYIRHSSIYENIWITYKLIATKACYSKYRKTKNLRDLVLVWKGVPPYAPYIKNLTWIMNEIDKPTK